MTARLTLWLLLCLTLGLACLPAAAQDLITERAYLEDPRGTRTLSQLQSQGADFSDMGKNISLGYTRSTLWVRLRVALPLNAPRVALRVLPAQLEEVRVFAPDLPDAGYPRTGHTTWLDVRPGLSTLYLRIQTSGPMLLEPRILSEVQAQQEDVARGFVWGAVLACYAPLLVWLWWLSVTHRQWLHPVLFLNLSIVVISFFAWTGYRPDVFSPTMVYFLGLMNIFTGYLSIWLVLSRFGAPRLGQRVFAVLGVLYMPLFGLFFVLERQLVMVSSTALGAAASLLCLPLTVVVFRHQKNSTRLIGVLLFFALLLALRWLLTMHGLLPPVESPASLFIFRIFFTVVFTFTTLLLLDREKQSQLETSRMNEAVAQQRAASETQRRQTQERFMTMLMHELKTPLAIIQLAASSLGRRLAPDSSDATRIKNIHRAVDDLNALVERCAAVDQIDQGALQQHKQPMCVVTLAHDVLQTVGAARIKVQGPAQCMVLADAQDLRLILLNLLGNALKYSPPDSAVELRFEATAAQGVAGVTLSVVNAVGAAGLPDAAQVFTRYYRAEGARCQVGAGLGLWLAQALARQMGTELTCQSDREQVVFGLFLEAA